MNDVTSFRAFFQVRDGSTSPSRGDRRRRGTRTTTMTQETAQGRLQDKVAIVTGASSGIGRATAKLFAAEGAKVVVGARREAELAGLWAEIKRSGGSAGSLARDVRSEDYARALVALAGKTYGRLDVRFNNARNPGGA